MKLVRAHKIQDSMSSRACDMAYISRKETEGSLVTKGETMAKTRNINK